MHKLEFAPAVQAKLDEIYEYIADVLQAPQAATSTVAGIVDGLSILKNNPDVGPRLSSRIAHVPRRFSETRFLVCGNYIAIYDHDDMAVQIIRIYHGSEDFFGRLFKEIS